MPMEAQACGTPVIGLAAGGLADVVQDGVTGVLVPAQTAEEFAKAVTHFRTCRFDASAIREHARQFHEDMFRERIRREVTDAATSFRR